MRTLQGNNAKQRRLETRMLTAFGRKVRERAPQPDGPPALCDVLFELATILAASLGLALAAHLLLRTLGMAP